MFEIFAFIMLSLFRFFATDWSIGAWRIQDLYGNQITNSQWFL